MAAKQPKAKRGDGTPSRAAKSGKKAPGQTGKQDNMLEPSGLTEPHQRPEKSSHTQPPDQGPVASQPVDFPVVGLGASAGGLEALKEFLAATPGDLTAALVVLLHEDPTRASHLTEILAECYQPSGHTNRGRGPATARPGPRLSAWPATESDQGPFPGQRAQT
jgi:chemotaxis response regulator CheB